MLFVVPVAVAVAVAVAASTTDAVDSVRPYRFLLRRPAGTNFVLVRCDDAPSWSVRKDASSGRLQNYYPRAIKAS